MERAGLPSAVVSCGDPGPLPEAGAAARAAVGAAGWKGAGAPGAAGTDALAAAGGTTAATGRGCAVVVPDPAPPPRPATLAGPAGRPVAEEPWAGADDDAARADESGTDATGRGVDLTVGAAGLGDAGAGADLALRASFPVDGCLINSLIRSTVDGSRLAKALTLTSSPQFWIRSSNSWLFSPSSFANS